MDDSRIVELFWARSADAVEACAAKYGGYCQSIARSILQSREDAEECVNDTWLGAWNAIPPHRPQLLSAFLGKLTRRIAINRYKRLTAAKRCGEVNLVLDELAECLPGGESAEEALDMRELSRCLSDFVRALPERERMIFVRRYFYSDPIPTIAGRAKVSENNVSVILSRLREKLRRHLETEGFSI
ncbi:MAG: sigma-70 family RNA polymerase sigma factor [Clostridia bacterium]|nr:sigma-70 family RNA polymerase sigma factor [Clostridia bacterium]